jgi:acyl carrier protein
MIVGGITKKLVGVLRQHVELPENNPAFPMDADLEELGIDSVRFIDLLLGIEATFGISFPDSLLTEEAFRTPSAIRDAIQSLVDEGASSA